MSHQHQRLVAVVSVGGFNEILQSIIVALRGVLSWRREGGYGQYAGAGRGLQSVRWSGKGQYYAEGGYSQYAGGGKGAAGGGRGLLEGQHGGLF